MNSLKDITAKLKKFLRQLKRYRVSIFAVFIAVVYGWLVFQINSLNSAEPTVPVSNQVKLRVDPEVVQQLETLQDNSVSVEALFNEARSNPFEN
jgi:hypothetical protein